MRGERKIERHRQRKRERERRRAGRDQIDLLSQVSAGEEQKQQNLLSPLPPTVLLVASLSLPTSVLVLVPIIK